MKPVENTLTVDPSRLTLPHLISSVDARGRGFIDKPYFRVRGSVADLRIDGIPNCSFGHKMDQSTPGKEEGIFAEWKWDGARLTVRNDRYGFFPLFYVHDADGVCVSPSLVTLLEQGAPTTLNVAGLAVFLRLGFFIGDDTPFEAIRVLPPGATLEWQDGSFHIASQGPVIAKTRHIPYEEAIDTYAALFKAAIRRFAPPSDKFVVALSGGRDSRHILLELCEAGFRPDACVTQRYFPPSLDEDTAIAAQLCRVLDLKHVIVEQSPSRLSAELRKNVLTHFCADEHSWALPLADYIRGRWDYVYDGLAGDVLSAGLFLTAKHLALFETGDFDALANEIMENDGYLSCLLPAREYKRFNRALAIQHLVSELRRHADAPNPVGSFYFYNRTRREIALYSFSLLGEAAVSLTPYLDRELYDFLASLPAHFFLTHQFHTQTILRAYPRYAHILYESRECLAAPDIKYFRRFAVETLRYVLQGRGGYLLHRSSVALRVLRCLVDRNYSQAITHFGPLAVYLHQLEGIEGAV
jgi:asparagine synthase (glutamine-hydrolysing)